MMRLIKSGGGMAYNVVASATSMGVGLGVVGCQIGLYIGFAATNKVLDGTVATVNFGSNLITMGFRSGRYIETLFFATIKAIQFHALELRNLIVNVLNAVRKPGDGMLGLIRTCSEKLNVQLIKFREQYIEQHCVVRKVPAGDSLLNSASSAITYLEQLDTTLANAQDIRQVPEQVLNEAKRKLTDIAQWSYALLPFPSSKAAVNINEEAAPKSPEVGAIEPEPEEVDLRLGPTILVESTTAGARIYLKPIRKDSAASSSSGSKESYGSGGINREVRKTSPTKRVSFDDTASAPADLIHSASDNKKDAGLDIVGKASGKSSASSKQFSSYDSSDSKEETKQSDGSDASSKEENPRKMGMSGGNYKADDDEKKEESK